MNKPVILKSILFGGWWCGVDRFNAVRGNTVKQAWELWYIRETAATEFEKLAYIDAQQEVWNKGGISDF